MLRDRLCTMLPPVLVAAAYSKSVPTAVEGWMPNKRISSGVISDPPPTPVMPTRTPTPKHDAAYRGSIMFSVSPTAHPQSLDRPQARPGKVPPRADRTADSASQSRRSRDHKMDMVDLRKMTVPFRAIEKVH